MKNQLARNGLIAFAAQMVVNICNFLFHAAVSRRIGVPAYGSLNALVAGFNIVAVPAVIATTVIAKSSAQLAANGLQASLVKLAANARTMLVCVAIIVGVIGSLLSPMLAAYLHISDVVAVRLTVGIIAFNLALPIRGLLQGAERFESYAKSLVSEAAVKVILAVLLTRLGYGLSGALFGWLLGTAVSYAYTVFVVSRGSTAKSNAKGAADIEFWRSGGAITLTTLCVTSLGYIDIVLVKHYFDPVTAGLYGAAALSGRMIYFLVSFVPIVLLPRAASLVASGRSPRPALFQALSAVVALSLISMLPYFFGAREIVMMLAGNAFSASASLVLPYALAIVFLGFAYTVTSYYVAINEYRFLLPLAVLTILEPLTIAAIHPSAIFTVHLVAGFNLAAAAAVLLSSIRLAKRDKERLAVPLHLASPDEMHA